MLHSVLQEPNIRSIVRKKKPCLISSLLNVHLLRRRADFMKGRLQMMDVKAIFI